MEVPNYNDKTREPSGRTGIIVFFLLFIVVICLAAFVYMRSKDIDIANVRIKDTFSDLLGAKGKSVEEEKPTIIEYDIKDHPTFYAYGNVLIKCTRDYVKGLDRKGKEVWSVATAANNPLVKTNGNELLVTDIGGKEIYVIKGKSISWTAKLEENILNAHISKDGYVTIVNEARGYRGQVRVFDSSGIEMFKRFVAQNFVLSAEVSPSGGQFLINYIDASGIKAGSYVDFFDVKELMSGRKEPVAGMMLDDEDIFPFVWQMKDDSLFAVGCSTVVYIDKKRDKKWVGKYEKIYSSGIIQDKYLILAATGTGSSGETDSSGVSSSRISILSEEGNETASYPIKEEVKNIQAYDDMIAANTGREVHFINAKGKLVSKYSFKSDVLNVYFLSRLEAAVVTRNNVEIIKI